jgi:hypothetical protein
MESLMVIFSADANSELNVLGASVFDNAPNNLWTAVNVDVNSVGNIVNSTFDNNANTEYVFAALTDSTLNLQSVFVDGAIGGNVLVPSATSAVAFASIDSTINFDRVEFTDISNFLVRLIINTR